MVNYNPKVESKIQEKLSNINNMNLLKLSESSHFSTQKIKWQHIFESAGFLVYFIRVKIRIKSNFVAISS